MKLPRDPHAALATGTADLTAALTRPSLALLTLWQAEVETVAAMMQAPAQATATDADIERGFDNMPI